MSDKNNYAADGNFWGYQTITTTSLAVLKRTARQGAHWKHEERGPRKVPAAPKGGTASNGSDGNFLGNHKCPVMAGARPPLRPKRQPFQAGTAYGATKNASFCKIQQEATTGKLSDGNFLGKKTKTTTSLAVMKRTARQGEHWNNGELSPPKSTRSPALPGEAAQTLPTATFWGITPFII